MNELISYLLSELLTGFSEFVSLQSVDKISNNHYLQPAIGCKIS